MGTNKRLEDLTAYKGVLPYASELFGVYQPLIGWKSKRTQQWLSNNNGGPGSELLSRLIPLFETRDKIEFNADCNINLDLLNLAELRRPKLLPQRGIVLQSIREKIELWIRETNRKPTKLDDWRAIITEEALSGRVEEGALVKVLKFYRENSIVFCKTLRSALDGARAAVFMNEQLAEKTNQHAIKVAIEEEEAVASILFMLLKFDAQKELDEIFFEQVTIDSETGFKNILERKSKDFPDPFLSFDPKNGTKDVSISPLGIVHLFRQYFFELDTFLGTPVGHFWLSPGSTLELIETSTRRTLVEKTTEVSQERIQKAEKTTTDQDDISTAVKQDNKDDLKLGVTATVNQSWGTGNASASASLNMDKTQQTARETTHKRMRQQSEKVSTEMKESYKTTLRTVTESTDVNSKRYVIANTSNDLLNYEFRRKMRQVGVQVQDIGSYLCWETFVDDPGNDLGLANLIHLAKPADLLPLPSRHKKQPPPNQRIPFSIPVVWDFGDNTFYNFKGLRKESITKFCQIPDGYEIVPPREKYEDIFPLYQISGSGEDFHGIWAFGGKYDSATKEIEVGVVIYTELNWDERVDFAVGGTIEVRPGKTILDAIALENSTVDDKITEATIANTEKERVASITAIQERIEQARSIKKRDSFDLREEERIIIYRRLIEALMTDNQYRGADTKTRHTLSVLINTIFDIDKMLYFVAPEWWRPIVRRMVSASQLSANLTGSIVPWDGEQNRIDNYLITSKSDPAPMGASLGWLLQLDGDDLRNAFLNAPWVKTVIPIRPGKEQAALVWLKGAGVEGADGLENDYAAVNQAELDEINQKLGRSIGTKVTILDALEYLCETVASKDKESRGVKSYPMTEINDDNKVSATPIEKVYEHGFYPLRGGFRVQPDDPNVDSNNKDKNFQVFDQWVEVVPTDQIVPVKVEYDPRTGRQR